MKRKKAVASILFFSLLMLFACSQNIASKSDSPSANPTQNNRSTAESKSDTSTNSDNSSSIQFNSESSTSKSKSNSDTRSDLESGSETSTSATNSRVDNGTSGETTFDINGVQIAIDPAVGGEGSSSTDNSSVTIDSQMSSQEATSSSQINVNGTQVEVVNSNLRINGRSYCQVKSGDKVFIGTQGVRVNGKQRGSLGNV
jgi:uncharacterized Zn-binding protein involved in type VI secretion